MFSGMFDLIARVLAFFYSLPVVGDSYGMAIILLTGAVMILLMPLTVRATRSTIKMQQVQPQIKELQKKYRDDRTQLNQELMAVYQANGINPVGGCIPMVAQLPVFLVLFNVLRGLSRRVNETPYFSIAERAREMAGGQPVVGDTFDPKYLSHTSDMYVDLHGTDEMGFLFFDLADRAIDVIQSNVFSGIPYVLLILFVVATSYYQQKQVSARRKTQPGSTPSPMNNQQEMILKFLPLLSGVWSFVFPAGLVLYWATSNVFRIGQQAYITRAVYGKDGEDNEDDSGAAANRTSASVSDAPTAGSTKVSQRQGQLKSGGKGKSDSSNASSPSADSNGAESEPDSASGSGATANGSASNGAVSRSQRWEDKRRQRAQLQAKAESRKIEQSSRITPKGTKPGGAKKKRKR